MSATAKGNAPATIGDATRACLYAVVDRFNTDEAFWGSFVPVADLTEIGADHFRLTLQGRGVLVAIRCTMLHGIGDGARFVPTIIVGAIPTPSPETADTPSPREPAIWHRVACAVGEDGKFITSNFRAAIEASIGDIQA